MLVLALTAIGLPVLAGGRGGLGVFAGPSAGYLLGWIAGVIVIGLIAHPRSGRPRGWRVVLGCLVGGIGVVYLFGIPVQALVLGTPIGPTALSSLVFLPGDLLKVALTTVLTLALARAYPRAFGAGTPSRTAARDGVAAR